MTAARQIRQENNLYYIHSRLARSRREPKKASWLPMGFFIFFMAAFVAISLMQTFELSRLLSRAKAIKEDIACVSYTRSELVKQYESHTHTEEVPDFYSAGRP